MKYKLIICTLVAIFLVNCEVKLQKANAQKESYWDDYVMYPVKLSTSAIGCRKIVINNMEYALFNTCYGNGDGTNPVLVNLTKDKLEIELLKYQIKSLQKKSTR